jgi:hypothetical protein
VEEPNSHTRRYLNKGEKNAAAQCDARQQTKQRSSTSPRTGCSAFAARAPATQAIMRSTTEDLHDDKLPPRQPQQDPWLEQTSQNHLVVRGAAASPTHQAQHFRCTGIRRPWCHLCWNTTLHVIKMKQRSYHHGRTLALLDKKQID